MYAVIETGGKQYRVKEGDVITVEKLNVEVGEKVTFDKVLVVSDGKEVQLGTPYLDFLVYGEALENGKGKKVIIFKYRSKKDSRTKQGHRQPYTMIEITGIGTDKPKAKKVAPKSEAVKEEETKVAEVKEEKAKKTDETKESKPKSVSTAMKKDELIAFAKDNNIEIDEKATKQVIIDTIKESLK